MDARYTGETAKHLEKQNELLWEAYRSMSHELHKLQVEEEMLMRKFFEVMSAHGLTKKKEDVNDILDELMKSKNDAQENSRPEQSEESDDETEQSKESTDEVTSDEEQ